MEQSLAGIVLLRDTRPDEPEELIAPESLKVLGFGEEEEEPAPPKPFEFNR